jgi:hypothetical protein
LTFFTIDFCLFQWLYWWRSYRLDINIALKPKPKGGSKVDDDIEGGNINIEPVGSPPV